MNYLVTDFGVLVNSNSNQTVLIQSIINKCNKDGGGEVIFPTGFYNVDSIRLKSNVTVHLLENTIISGSKNYLEYRDFFKENIDDSERIPIEPDCKSNTRNVYGEWNNAVIRGYFDENISIIGEKGSKIIGNNCYNPEGEEGYRGPHLIALYGCKNFKIKGVTLEDAGNYGIITYKTENVDIVKTNINGGHDGIDLWFSTNINIFDCDIKSGDDCVAGYNDDNVHVKNCKLNSACSCVRSGARNLLVEDCEIYGDGIYAHRYSLSQEEKEAGAPSNSTHRHNTLTGFLYFWGSKSMPLYPAENIVFKNCKIDHVERLYCQPLSEHRWCSGRGPRDVTFLNCVISNTNLPSYLNSLNNVKTTFTLDNCVIKKGRNKEAELFIIANNCDVIVKNCNFDDYDCKVVKLLISPNSSFKNIDSTKTEIVYLEEVNVDAY